MEQKERETRRESLVAGLVGAFLGSLLGMACIIVVSQLGYVASLCGVVMAVCTLKGYELLGGVLSRKGAAAAGIITVVMTYVAYQIDCAIQVAVAAEVDVFLVFRNMGMLLEGGYLDTRAYWGGLALLYLFTLLGAAPLLIAALRGGTEPAIPPEAVRAKVTEEAPSTCQYYPAHPTWMRTLRLSVFLPLLAVVLVILLPLALAASGNSSALPVIASLIGGLVGMFSMCAAAFALARPCDAFRWIFVRRDGVLWRVQLNMLNMVDTYRFTEQRIRMSDVRWDKLTQSEQAQAKASIERAIRVLCSEGVLPGSALSRIVQCLPETRLESENKWAWKISYQTQTLSVPPERGARRVLQVAKAYPGFAPAVGAEPPTGPAPGRWWLGVLAVLLMILLTAGGYMLGVVLEGGGTAESGRPARWTEPEITTQYQSLGVTFHLPGALVWTEEGSFADPETGMVYTVTVELGATEEMAVDALIAPIGEYRLRPDFDGFSLAHTNTDQDLVAMATRDRLSCLHNLITIRFTDGSTVQSGVALAQDLFSTLVRVEVSGGSQVDEETVQNTILYILEGMEFTGPTKENYQEMYHLGREEGYTLVGIALVPTPYEEDPFLRVPLPYGGAVTYLEDGGVLAQAHGLRIRARACWSPEGPQAIVEEAWAQVQAENRELYQDGIFDSEYDAETDIATKQFSFWEGDEARLSFLVAQPMRDEGRYRFMEVTYIPEEMDDDYPALIQEFSHASDLFLPELEPF